MRKFCLFVALAAAFAFTGVAPTLQAQKKDKNGTIEVNESAKDGKFRLEMPQIIPAFGQPHGHLAYDSGAFKTVFLRPRMASVSVTSLEAHFVLQPV